ncbi:hypothetical protein STENM327S_03629 [Streptomyces tendae]
MLLDGTLLPIDRIAADRPFYSGCEDDGVSFRPWPVKSHGGIR